MYSWLVTVLLLASTATAVEVRVQEGGMGVRGKGESVPDGIGIHFHSQVHKCPSQAINVH